MPVANRKFTLGKQERLKSRKTIDRLFREGRQFAFFPLKVYYLVLPALVPSVPLQAGFSAGSRYFKRAVDRNRIKRLMREAYRMQKHELQDRLHDTGLTLALFIIYTGKELPGQSLLREKIGVALQKLAGLVGPAGQIR